MGVHSGAVSGVIDMGGPRQRRRWRDQHRAMSDGLTDHAVATLLLQFSVWRARFTGSRQNRFRLTDGK
jgi:hypothetical protein